MPTLEEIAAKATDSNEPARFVLSDGRRFVVQSEADYEALMDKVEEARFETSILEGICEMEAGLGTPAEEAFAGAMKRFGL